MLARRIERQTDTPPVTKGKQVIDIGGKPEVRFVCKGWGSKMIGWTRLIASCDANVQALRTRTDQHDDNNCSTILFSIRCVAQEFFRNWHPTERGCNSGNFSTLRRCCCIRRELHLCWCLTSDLDFGTMPVLSSSSQCDISVPCEPACFFLSLHTSVRPRLFRVLPGRGCRQS